MSPYQVASTLAHFIVLSIVAIGLLGCTPVRSAVTTTLPANDSIVQGHSMAEVAVIVRSVGGDITHELPIIAAIGARLTPAQVKQLLLTPGITHIYADRKVQVAGPPQTYSNYPQLVGADKLHAAGITGKSVSVAVLDTGSWDTPAIQKNTINGHGSHVAGIIWGGVVDYASGIQMGVAPQTNLLSVRVLDENGIGSYADLIAGIQFVVENRDLYGIRVLNLSLSAQAITPYFEDPLNRTVEAAWASGIVVVAAAGNMGPDAETITVPGNDPYVLTVGALDDNRTPGYWADDSLPPWTASGPTQDGFVKPDVIAPGQNIISFMYNDASYPEKRALLARQHPDYVEGVSLFRMHGTSMATAVTSGVVALMLQVNPELSPDQVKLRLMQTAHSIQHDPTASQTGNLFRHGAGRIWAPAANSSTRHSMYSTEALATRHRTQRIRSTTLPATLSGR